MGRRNLVTVYKHYTQILVILILQILKIQIVGLAIENQEAGPNKTVN